MFSIDMVSSLYFPVSTKKYYVQMIFLMWKIKYIYKKYFYTEILFERFLSLINIVIPNTCDYNININARLNLVNITNYMTLFA